MGPGLRRDDPLIRVRLYSAAVTVLAGTALPLP